MGIIRFFKSRQFSAAFEDNEPHRLQALLKKGLLVSEVEDSLDEKRGSFFRRAIWEQRWELAPLVAPTLTFEKESNTTLSRWVYWYRNFLENTPTTEQSEGRHAYLLILDKWTESNPLEFLKTLKIFKPMSTTEWIDLGKRDQALSFGEKMELEDPGFWERFEAFKLATKIPQIEEGSPSPSVKKARL